MGRKKKNNKRVHQNRYEGMGEKSRDRSGAAASPPSKPAAPTPPTVPAASSPPKTVSQPQSPPGRVVQPPRVIAATPPKIVVPPATVIHRPRPSGSSPAMPLENLDALY